MVEHLEYDCHEEKSRRIGLILATLAGPMGAHKFYIGHMRAGSLYVVLSFLSGVLIYHGMVMGSMLNLQIGGVLFVLILLYVTYDFIRIWRGTILDCHGHDLLDHVGQSHPCYAGFWTRFAAHLMDSIFVSLVVLGVMLAILAYSYISGDVSLLVFFDDRTGDSIIDIFQLFIALLYYTLLTITRHKATWGKRFCGIMVIKKSDHEAIGILRSFWRFLCYAFSYLPFLLGFILVAFTPDKRGLHDYFAGTIVVHRIEKGNWMRKGDKARTSSKEGKQERDMDLGF